MCDFIPIIFYLFILVRISTLCISILNERRLKAEGCQEFGKKNTVFLILSHFAFYFCCMSEGLANGAFICDAVSLFGGMLMLLSMVALFCVIGSLGNIWTIKIIIAKKSGHVLNKGFLFRVFKHPSYYLNVLPELVGLSLFFQAPYSLFLGVPLYCIPLIIRIKQEERAMKLYFSNY